MSLQPSKDMFSQRSMLITVPLKILITNSGVRSIIQDDGMDGCKFIEALYDNDNYPGQPPK